MSIINNISYKYKASFFIALIILLSVLLSLYTYKAFQKNKITLSFSQESGELASYSGKLNFAFINFENSLHNENFYDYRQDEYTDYFYLLIDSCNRKTQNLTDIVEEIDYNLLDELQNVSKKIENCEANFRLLVQNKIEIGNARKGYFAEVIFYEKNVFQKIDLYAPGTLKQQFMNSAKFARNIYLHQNITEIDDFNNDIKKLLGTLSNNQNSGAKQITDALLEYYGSVNAMANLINTNGNNLNSGIKKEMSQEIFALINLVNNLQIHATKISNENFKSKKRITLAMNIAFALISTLFIIVLVILRRKNLNIIKQNSKNILNFNYSFADNELDTDFKEINNNISDANKFIKNLNRTLINIKDEKYDKVSISEKPDNAVELTVYQLNTQLKTKKEELKLERKEKETEEQNSATLAKFSDLLRKKYDNTTQLGIEILAELTKYIDAQVAGLYIVNKENNQTVLQLTASYAYNEKRIIDKQYKEGEGLIGACAIEKTSFYFEEIDDDYIKIVSGMGEIKPDKLLITPILLGNDLYGILEIATLNAFSKNQISFIERLCTEIAGTLSLLKYN